MRCESLLLMRVCFLRFLLILFILFPFNAYADVKLTFYSHDFGSAFPHTFIEARGVLENGTPINEDFGFTAQHISPRILLGSVKGIIKAPPADYKANSDAQFTIIVSEEVYGAILNHRMMWQSGRKRNYNLDKRNCVHFVSSIAELAGLKVNANSSNFKKPKSFLREIISLNPSLTPLSPASVSNAETD